MNDLVFINDVIYGLKMEYGSPIRFIREGATTDLDTGDTTPIVTSDFTIARGIPLPLNLRAAFLKSIGVARMGYLEQGQREILLHNSDIPAGKSIEIQDVVIMNGKREQIVKKPEVFDYGTIIVTQT